MRNAQSHLRCAKSSAIQIPVLPLLTWGIMRTIPGRVAIDHQIDQPLPPVSDGMFGLEQYLVSLKFQQNLPGVQSPMAHPVAGSQSLRVVHHFSRQFQVLLDGSTEDDLGRFGQASIQTWQDETPHLGFRNWLTRTDLRQIQARMLLASIYQISRKSTSRRSGTKAQPEEWPS